MSNSTEPAATRDPIAGTPMTTQDIVATLAAMQDQIDDLTAVVEAQQKHLDELSGPPRGGRPAH